MTTNFGSWFGVGLCAQKNYVALFARSLFATSFFNAYELYIFWNAQAFAYVHSIVLQSRMPPYSVTFSVAPQFKLLSCTSWLLAFRTFEKSFYKSVCSVFNWEGGKIGWFLWWSFGWVVNKNAKILCWKMCIRSPDGERSRLPERNRLRVKWNMFHKMSFSFVNYFLFVVRVDCNWFRIKLQFVVSDDTLID